MEKMHEGSVYRFLRARHPRGRAYDGKMHPVDSKRHQLQDRRSRNFREAFNNADPQLMEPVQEVEWRRARRSDGDVMTDQKMARPS